MLIQHQKPDLLNETPFYTLTGIKTQPQAGFDAERHLRKADFNTVIASIEHNNFLAIENDNSAVNSRYYFQRVFCTKTLFPQHTDQIPIYPGTRTFMDQHIVNLREGKIGSVRKPNPTRAYIYCLQNKVYSKALFGLQSLEAHTREQGPTGFLDSTYKANQTIEFIAIAAYWKLLFGEIKNFVQRYPEAEKMALKTMAVCTSDDFFTANHHLLEFAAEARIALGKNLIPLANQNWLTGTSPEKIDQGFEYLRANNWFIIRPATNLKIIFADEVRLTNNGLILTYQPNFNQKYTLPITKKLLENSQTT